MPKLTVGIMGLHKILDYQTLLLINGCRCYVVRILPSSPSVRDSMVRDF